MTEHFFSDASGNAVEFPIRLTSAQHCVVFDSAKRIQVIACAGSGKTRSIAARVARLIRDGEDPSSIVAFTFTEKAATELKDRIYDYTGRLMGADYLGRLGPLFVGTIHAFCFQLLQEHSPRFGNHDVLDTHRHVALVSRQRYELGLNVIHQRHWESIQRFLNAADLLGNELIPVDALGDHPLASCITAYREMLERHRFLTFGQIISLVVELLETDAEVRKSVRQRIRHLIVDEYQDINPAQDRLIQLLAEEPASLCVVGDDDQAIYQWRGSDVRTIVEFEQHYQNVSTHRLVKNYRSRPAIVMAASAFARSIPGRLEKEMEPARDSAPLQIMTWMGEDPDDECATIADHMLQLHHQGWAYRDMAVLFRSVRSSAGPLIKALESRGIPFACGGRTGLFSHPEMNAFGELFSWMAEFSWKDHKYGESRDAALDTVLEVFSATFGIDEQELPELKLYFMDWKRWHKEHRGKVNLVGDYYKILERLGVGTLDPESPSGSSRLGVLARFSRILADYEHVTMRSRHDLDDSGRRVFRPGQDRGASFWKGLANYLLHYAKASYEDFAGEEVLVQDAVSILTVHQSKGLEWPILFLPALSKLRFPSSMAGRKQEWAVPDSVFPPELRARYEGGDGEERRLFYVAMTRAQEVLYASTFSQIKKKAPPSPYLLELTRLAGGNSSDIPRLSSLPLPVHPSARQEPEVPPLEVGYSALAEYEDCGYRYRLAVPLGFENTIVAELGYGRAVHHVLRQLAEYTRLKGESPGPQEVEAIVDGELYVPFAGAASFSNMRRSVLGIARRYLEKWGDDLHRIWACERPFEIHLEGGILSGRADVILDREEGKPDNLAILDYKTSAGEERNDRYERQLQVYAAAGRQEGLEIDALYLHDLKQGERSLVPSALTDSGAAIRWAGELVASIKAGRYPSRPDAKKCDSCDFMRVCCYAGNDRDTIK